MRTLLPARRRCETFEMQHAGLNFKFAITVGYYPDGSIGEVFIDGAKAGSEAAVVTRDGAILLSLALQHGVPLDTIGHAISRNPDGKASSIVGAVIDEIIKREKPCLSA